MNTPENSDQVPSSTENPLGIPTRDKRVHYTSFCGRSGPHSHLYFVSIHTSVSLLPSCMVVIFSKCSGICHNFLHLEPRCPSLSKPLLCVHVHMWGWPCTRVCMCVQAGSTAGFHTSPYYYYFETDSLVKPGTQ